MGNPDSVILSVSTAFQSLTEKAGIPFAANPDHADTESLSPRLI
jgi:hypothetical protein